MTTNNPNTQSRNEATRKVTPFLTQASFGLLRLVLFTAVVPTWVLGRFGYGLDAVTVWSVGMLGSLLVLAGGLASGFSSLEKPHASGNGNVPVRISRRLAMGSLKAVFTMLVFGALEFNVGLLHILIAYVAPSAAWSVVEAAVRKFRRPAPADAPSQARSTWVDAVEMAGRPNPSFSVDDEAAGKAWRDGKIDDRLIGKEAKALGVPVEEVVHRLETAAQGHGTDENTRKEG